MTLLKKTFRSTDELEQHIRSGVPSFYFASMTSTVIPYDKLEKLFSGSEDFALCDLSTIPGEMRVLENGDLEVRGSSTWKDAKEFCQTKGRNILTSPTEELASILSGVATSATGERCFGFGTLREQIVEVEYLDYHGETQILKSSKKLMDHNVFNSKDSKEKLQDYQKDYSTYQSFKNAPGPRLVNETDLLTGTEGQLGIITRVVLKTSPHLDITYIFLHLPKWEENFAPHMEVFEKVQKFRDRIFSCEIIDENSLSVLDPSERPVEGKDIIFLEIESKHFESLYEELLSQLELIDENDIFEITPSKCRELRMAIPRATFERNAKMGVIKKGTDVQVTPDKFPALMEFYKDWSTKGVEYNLFGHFGDAHLHFNFMPTGDQAEFCQELLHELYRQVKIWNGSPFAEHGIGLIKQRFIDEYYDQNHYDIFQDLKKKMDPDNIFFPQGFMNLHKAIS